jgi:UDP-glucose 4-epimerase
LRRLRAPEAIPISEESHRAPAALLNATCDPDGEIGERHVPETHVIPQLLDVAAGASDRFTPFGDDYSTADGTCIRNYIHVRDLTDAHVQAMRALLGGAESAALSIGTGRAWSVRDLIDCARQVANRDIAVQVGPRGPAILQFWSRNRPRRAIGSTGSLAMPISRRR